MSFNVRKELSSSPPSTFCFMLPSWPLSIPTGMRRRETLFLCYWLLISLWAPVLIRQSSGFRSEHKVHTHKTFYAAFRVGMRPKNVLLWNSGEGEKKMAGIRYVNMCLRPRPTGMKSKLKALKKQKTPQNVFHACNVFDLFWVQTHRPLSSATSQTVKLWSDKIACEVRGGWGLHPAGHAGIRSAYFWPCSSGFASGPVWAD